MSTAVGVMEHFGGYLGGFALQVVMVSVFADINHFLHCPGERTESGFLERIVRDLRNALLDPLVWVSVLLLLDPFPNEASFCFLQFAVLCAVRVVRFVRNICLFDIFSIFVRFKFACVIRSAGFAGVLGPS